MNHAVLVLQQSFGQDELAPDHNQPLPLVQVRSNEDIGYTPVSSSIDRKMKPFAVPGRCRAMTQPAVRTNSPSVLVFSSSAERMFRRSKS
jgi:hypothetical protein